MGLAVLPIPVQESAAKVAHTSPPWMVRIADEAPIVVASMQNGGLGVFDAATGKVLRAMAEPLSGAEIWRLELDPSGELVALLTRDNRVWLWNWRDDGAPKAVATLQGEPQTEFRWRFGAALEFDPTGKRLLVGHGTAEARLLDRAGETVASFLRADNEKAASDAADVLRLPDSWMGPTFAWSNNGKRLALVTTRGPCVLRTADGTELASGFFPRDAIFQSVALNSDGTRLASGRRGGIVTMQDVKTKARLWNFEHVCPFFGPHDGEWSEINIGDLSFSPDETRIAATSTTGICGILLDSKSGEELWTGDHCGGRMGEPASITWLSGGEGFYFAFVSGVMPIEQVRLQAPENRSLAEQSRKERGTTPDVGWKGVGVYVSQEAICAVKGTTFDPIWRRPADLGVARKAAQLRDSSPPTEKEEHLLYGFLRDTELIWSEEGTGGTVDIFGTGLRRSAEASHTRRLVYCASVDTGGKCVVRWTFELPGVPYRVIRQRLRIAPEDGDDGTIALQADEESVRIVSCGTGETAFTIDDAWLLDHGSLPDGKTATVFARGGAIFLWIDCREIAVRFGHGAHAVLGAKIVKGSPAGGRLLVATHDGERMQAHVVELTSSEDPGSHSSELVYESPEDGSPRVNSMVALDHRYAFSVGRSARGHNFVVAGSLPSPDLLRDRSGDRPKPFELTDPADAAKHSFGAPNFGEALCLTEGRVLASRPGDQEVSALLAWNPDGSSPKVTCKGRLGENLGTDLQWLAPGTVAVNAGGDGTAIFHRNGELRVLRLKQDRPPETVLSLGEATLIEALVRPR